MKVCLVKHLAPAAKGVCVNYGRGDYKFGQNLPRIFSDPPKKGGLRFHDPPCLGGVGFHDRPPHGLMRKRTIIHYTLTNNVLFMCSYIRLL